MSFQKEHTAGDGARTIREVVKIESRSPGRDFIEQIPTKFTTTCIRAGRKIDLDRTPLSTSPHWRLK